MPTHGFTLGKFAPLHRGHQYLIETMEQEMELATVMIYDAPEVTKVPLPVRAGWLRQLYPALTVLESWDGPSEVGNTPAIQAMHDSYLRSRLQNLSPPITHFYSSEAYGEPTSRALGAINRVVDQERRVVPISATQIRQQPFRYRAYVHPLVYPDLITTAVFLGAPSTGKTTLAQALARLYDTAWMPEYGREYWETHQVSRRLSPAQLVEIAEGHIERENRLLQSANHYLFIDTDARTTAIFAQDYYDHVPARLAELASAAGSRYDLVFLCGDDIPYAETWDRSGVGKRTIFQKRIVADLHMRRQPYILLTGDLKARVATVQRMLARHQKYRNLLEPSIPERVEGNHS